MAFEPGSNLPPSASTQVQPLWQTPGSRAVAHPYLEFPEMWPQYSNLGAGMRRTHLPMSQKNYERVQSSGSGAVEDGPAAPGHSLPGWSPPVAFTPPQPLLNARQAGAHFGRPVQPEVMYAQQLQILQQQAMFPSFAQQTEVQATAAQVSQGMVPMSAFGPYNSGI
eukprot:NODE_2165_length_636_cov_110.789784_g2115_i0.p1 GENE.NODE_2165_length_636_cov_110.789784_g2115_i0~~NODE_2165_length_636_cov_110.789784_g2115_i0.p1  ORF type:complete len:166 (+),score=39.49 NODE_2165_length_636_cov_110.789784_g2115_i0:82-579(+)